ncbi:MAG: lipopolysaccharide transport system ATP-binding protein, partial [Gaiellaceae bacterium]|nr:lipopolysaccharide transport system ATP-binding protein [Gaiellaceae bacterium]
MHCTGVAVCDDDGSVIGAVHQGQAIHILSEFEIDADIGLPSGWFALSDASGQLMYGTNSFRDGVTTREPPEHGTRLRCRFVVELDLAPGQYFLTVGLLSATAPEYLGYWQAPDDGTRWPEADGTEERAERYRHVGLTEEQFQDRLLQHSRVEHPHPIAVGFDKSGRQTHVGLVALRSRSGLELEPARGSSVADAEATGLPTVVHVTHHKAGSQWIYAILRALVPDRIVPPDARSGHFRYWPPEPGKVYPTVYLTRQQFDLVGVPDDCRRFVMIRDLRDTLVSSYFSLAATHGTPDRQSL